jgi:hypothetical protein
MEKKGLVVTSEAAKLRGFDMLSLEVLYFLLLLVIIHWAILETRGELNDAIPACTWTLPKLLEFTS